MDSSFSDSETDPLCDDVSNAQRATDALRTSSTSTSSDGFLNNWQNSVLVLQLGPNTVNRLDLLRAFGTEVEGVRFVSFAPGTNRTVGVVEFNSYADAERAAGRKTALIRGTPGARSDTAGSTSRGHGELQTVVVVAAAHVRAGVLLHRINGGLSREGLPG